MSRGYRHSDNGASVVFRDEVLMEAELKGSRTFKSSFAVISHRLVMVVVADAIHDFFSAIARRLWFIIEPMSTRATPIQVVIGVGLQDEPQAVIFALVEDGNASGRVILTQHYRVLDVLLDSSAE
jgi:hypothetical protein